MAVSDRLARIILRVYPPDWRIRYEVEMRALIEARPSGWAQVFDLARATVGPRELWLWVAWMVTSSAMHQWVRSEADLNVLLNWAGFNSYRSHTLAARRLVEARKQLDAATDGLVQRWRATVRKLDYPW